MSDGFNRSSRKRFQEIPRGEEVRQFTNYDEARAAVDKLARMGFPIKDLVIIGNDLKSVESVTGKLSYGRIALQGLASGAWAGLFIGLIFALMGGAEATTQTYAMPVVIGAGFGMLFNVVVYAYSRRRREFTSSTSVMASNYSVISLSGQAQRANAVLAAPESSEGTAKE
ncbi:MAG: hypothetical protein KF916_01005 [Microbacteriaceae bacterium]|nr:hypothetical protein [Microbacteriaceae bacterium]